MVANEFIKSIARTLGRIAAYIILGILAYFIFMWFDSDQVKAQSFTPNTMNFYGIDSAGGTYSFTINNVTSYTFNNPTWQFINGTQMTYSGLTIQPNKSYLFKIVVNYRTFYEQQLSFSPTIQFQLGGVSSTCDFMVENSNVQTEADSTNHSYSLRTIYSCYVDSTITASSMYLNYYTGKQQQLKNFSVELDITEKEPNQEDVITNNNANTDRILQSNYNNATRIIQGMIDRANDLLHSNGQTQQAVYDNTQAVETMDAHMTSESDADISLLSPINDLMPSNTPITDIITLPINILNKEIQSLGGTCSPWTINTGSLLGNYTWTFPCLNIAQYFTGYSYGGYNLWQLIDLMICLYMGYEILMLIISAYNSISNLEDPFSDLYKPKHEGYAMKHGEGRI